MAAFDDNLPVADIGSQRDHHRRDAGAFLAEYAIANHPVAVRDVLQRVSNALDG